MGKFSSGLIRLMQGKPNSTGKSCSYLEPRGVHNFNCKTNVLLTMEACELVRLIVNKALVPAEPKRRGNPGYGQLRAIRVLVYARLTRQDNDTRIVEHLKRHLYDLRKLSLNCVPDRTTVGRW
jgi:hypothetical protein